MAGVWNSRWVLSGGVVLREPRRRSCVAMVWVFVSVAAFIWKSMAREWWGLGDLRPREEEPTMTVQRPDPQEHADYYGLYIRQAPEGEILQVLADEAITTRRLLAGIPPEKEIYRYARDKWNLRELVGHLIDTEWTFTYRGLCFARADPAALPGFDQELWARNSPAGDRSLAALLDEFAATRAATVALFRGFGAVEWARSGVANDCSFSVRSMPYILAGHEVHHRKVIVERYLA